MESITKKSRSPRTIISRSKFNLIQFKRIITTPKYIRVDKYRQ